MTVYGFLKIFKANIPHSSVFQGNNAFLNRVINKRMKTGSNQSFHLHPPCSSGAEEPHSSTHPRGSPVSYTFL